MRAKLLPLLAAWLCAAPASAQSLGYLDAIFDSELMPPGGLNRAQAVAVSPDGRHVYAAADTTPALSVFAIDAVGGVLTHVETETGIPANPTSVAVSPDGNHVYVASSDPPTNPGAVTGFTRDAQSGALSNPQSIAAGDPGVEGLGGARSVALSPDGLHVYVAAPGDDSLVVFSRDPGDGSLTFVQAQLASAVPELIDPWEVRVSPDGSHVYAATLDTTWTGVGFTRGPMGLLGTPQPIAPNIVDGWSKTLDFSPSGDQVYFGGGNPNPPQDHAIFVYDRDAGTGTLTFAELFQGSEIPNPPGLELATVTSLAVAPNGASVVVSLDVDDAVIVLERDSGGDLSFLEALEDGPASDGLLGAADVVITRDGRFTLVAGKGDQAIALLAPEPMGEALTLAAIAACLGLAGIRVRPWCRSRAAP